MVTRSAVSSLRSHLPHRSRSIKIKRGSISSVFGRSGSVKATANSARGPETFAAEETIPSEAAEGKEAAEEAAGDDEASLVPLPSSPIKIPVPTLSLRMDFDSPAQFPRFDTADAADASVRALQDPANITTGLPVSHLLRPGEGPIAGGRQLMSEALSPPTSPSRKSVIFSPFSPFSSSPVRQELCGRSSPMPGTTAQLEIGSGPFEALPGVRPLTSWEISLYDQHEIHTLGDQKAGMDDAILSLFSSHALDTGYRLQSPHITATMAKRPRSPEPAAGFTLEHHNIDTEFDAAASFDLMGEHNFDTALEDYEKSRKRRHKLSSSRASNDQAYEEGIDASLKLEQEVYCDRALPQDVPRGKTCADLTEAERERFHEVRMANIKAGAKELIIAKVNKACKTGDSMDGAMGEHAARSSFGSHSDSSLATGSAKFFTFEMPHGSAQRESSAKIETAPSRLVKALKQKRAEAARQSLENHRWLTGYPCDLHGSRFKPGDAYGPQHFPGRGEIGVPQNDAGSASSPVATKNIQASTRDRMDAIVGLTRARQASSSEELTPNNSVSLGAGSPVPSHSTPLASIPALDLTTGVEPANHGPAAPPLTFQLAVRIKNTQSSAVQERYFPGTHVAAAESAPSRRQSSFNSDLDSIPSTRTGREESGNSTS